MCVWIFSPPCVQTGLKLLSASQTLRKRTRGKKSLQLYKAFSSLASSTFNHVCPKQDYLMPSQALKLSLYICMRVNSILLLYTFTPSHWITRAIRYIRRLRHCCNICHKIISMYNPVTSNKSWKNTQSRFHFLWSTSHTWFHRFNHGF